MPNKVGKCFAQNPVKGSDRAAVLIVRGKGLSLLRRWYKSRSGERESW